MIVKSEFSIAVLISKIKWNAVNAWQVLFNQFGLFGCIVVVSLCIALGLLVKKSQDVMRLQQLQQQEQQSNPTKKPVKDRYVDGHAKIKAFHKVLLPYNRIPGAIQDMLQLSSKHELTNVKGKYKAQVDSNGSFLRYQMVIPVKGDIQSITQYIKSVFFAQKTLALESIKFSRKNVDSDQIEARIQWVLFTRLPTHENNDALYLE